GWPKPGRASAKPAAPMKCRRFVVRGMHTSGCIISAMRGGVKGLARMLHQQSAAARDRAASTSLRSVAVLNVPPSTPAGGARRAPCICSPLVAPRCDRGETSELAGCPGVVRRGLSLCLLSSWRLFRRGFRSDGGEHGLEQIGFLEVFLRGRDLAMAEAVLVVATAAADFGRFVIDHRQQRVVGHALALDAIIVEVVTQPVIRHKPSAELAQAAPAWNRSIAHRDAEREGRGGPGPGKQRETGVLLPTR